MEQWLQKTALMAVTAILVASPLTLHAQVDPIGGPYTPDEHTRLLLQFEGNFENSSDQAPDAVSHGNAQIFPISARGELGQALYLQNDSRTDSSFVYVPHAEGLNLAGDWTIEMWFMIQTFGTSAEDHRWVPVLMWKRGDTTFDQGNYFMEIWGNTRHLSTGYSVAGHGWPQVNSPQNMIQPGEWYHATLIRDTEHNVLIQMIHDDEKNLLWSGTHTYNPETQAIPNITGQPLYLGTNWDDQAVQPGFMDGFMDEIRISDVVRNFAIPPVIRSLDMLANQPPEATEYPSIRSEVIQVGGSPISTVTLHYNAGNGWEEVEMSMGDELYEASIPQQPIHSIVQYYVTAENESGHISVHPSGALAAENPEYFVFAVEEPDTRTLHLTFEEGEGDPADHSVYDNPVTVFGQPTFSTDAAVGTYSLELNGVTDYLEVPTSVVSNHEEFTVDFWLNANSLEGPWRFIINKPAIVPGFWGENTYEIISQPDRRLTAGVWSGAGGNTRITLPDVVEFGEWYRVIMEVRRAPEGDVNNYYLFFQLNDENDELLSKDFAGFDHRPQVSHYPLRIGKAGGDRPYFDGKIDNFQYFNYAHAQIAIDAPPNIASVVDVPNQIESVTTYPPIEAEVVPGLGGAIDNVTLHYNAGDDWVETSMAHVEGNRYAADIPQQPVYTIVKYYVSATNANGFRALFPAGAESETSPDYLMFAVEQPNTQVLALTFDEGEGVPQDASSYNTTVVVHGAPIYSSESAAGSHALAFNGETDYLEVLSPLVGSSDEFSLDFWMRPNSLTGFWRFIVNKPALRPAFWGENTIEIITGAFDDPEPKITAGVWSQAGGNTRITLPEVLQMETWYRVIFEVQRAPAEAETNFYAIVQLRNADNEILAHDHRGFDEPPTQSRHPLRLGKAGGDRPFYHGMFDDVRFYNFPRHQLTLTSSEDGGIERPLEYTLSQNYPNPFNPATVIQYSVPESGLVTLRIFDMLGREVASLVNEDQLPGEYRVTFDASALASGLYFYQLQAGDRFSATKKMMLVK